MRRPVAFFMPIVLALVVFVAIYSSRGTPLVRRAVPNEALVAERCTWFCHNHGCPHRAKLPRVLTSDDALFGWTIRGLFRLGRTLSSDRAVGYGVANLLVFVVAWPAGTLALYALVLRQGAALTEVRAKRRAATRGNLATASDEGGVS